MTGEGSSSASAAWEGRFIGRTRDKGSVTALLASHATVTIWGPAGMGKTRLAREILALHAQNGAWTRFVDLSLARDADDICARVGAALGVDASTSRGGEDATDRIGHALAQRRTPLLVLDNFEQVVEHAHGTVDAWARAAPEARILVTSRERLRLAREASHELLPLGLPEENGAPSEAVELFIERVRALEPGYVVAPTSAASVASLVQKLEGIPLVIELAAARVGILGVEGLLARLPGRLDLLARGTRDSSPRQATLRGAIAWSWDLLLEPERAALAQAAIFRGGFTLEAAEAILSVAAPSVLEAIQSLRDRSLLTSVQTTEGIRFGMYESIRAFAEERLEASGSLEETASRHAGYYLSLATARRSGGVATLRVLASEHDNVMAVADRALADASIVGKVRALEAIVALEPVRAARESCLARVTALTRVIDAAHDTEVAPALLAEALRARGAALRTANEHAAARLDFERALTLARSARDVALEGAVLAEEGVLHHELRALDVAELQYEAALRIHRALGDCRAEGRTLANLSALSHDRGDFDLAREGYRRAIGIFVDVNDARLEGIHSMNLAVLEQEHGDERTAAALYGRAKDLLEAQGERRLLAITLGNLGSFHHARGQLHEAEASFARAVEVLGDVGDRRSEAMCLARLAGVRAALGEEGSAERTFELAERRAAGMTDPVPLAAIDLCRGFVDLMRAAQATSAADRAHHEHAVEERILRARREGELALAARSDDVRLTQRLLEQSLARLRRGEAPEAALDDAALVVGPDAAFFRPPGGAWHDLRERLAARRILDALVRHHRDRRTAGLTPDDLWREGWPGERVGASAQANRLNVTLAYLRKSGLRPHLRHDAGAYAIDPALRVQAIVTPPASFLASREG